MSFENTRKAAIAYLHLPNTFGEQTVYAYLFWGAEYWVRRQQSGDPRYLQAFARILEQSESVPP